MSELTLKVGGDSAQKEYQQPPLGDHKAVLVDIVKSENQPTKHGPKTKVFYYFELETKMEDGRPFLVRKGFNFTLNPLSTLYKFIVKWREAPLTPNENFELKQMIGAGCILEISPWSPDDEPSKVLHLPDRARKLDKKEWIKPSGEYDGEKIRERIEAKKEENNSAQPAVTVQKGATDTFTDPGEVEDDVPF